MKLKATCTWGDGPDVILQNEDLSIDIDLTAQEAKGLARDLLMAANQAEELEEIDCKEYFDEN